MAPSEAEERRPLLGSGTRRSSTAQDDHDAVSIHDLGSDNPLEWSKKYRWFCVGLLCTVAATVTYTCIGIVPVAGDVVKELKGHKDRSATVLFVTIWELGEATGPLFLAPMSELYGRYIVYNVANCLFVGGILISALSQDFSVLLFSRFMTGCAVAANVLNPAIIGDMFPSGSRGAPMSAVMLAPLIGGALGPTVSGSLAEATGWRQIIWLCLAVATLLEICFILLFRETYHPTILKRAAAKNGMDSGTSIEEIGIEEETQGTFSTLAQSMLRPARIIWSSSMLQLLSLWGGVVFAFFYVNSTSLPEILEVVYDFGPSKRGLSYLAWSLGSVIGIFTCNRSMDKIYNKLGDRHGGFYPEGRLPLPILGAFILPIAVALYGWTAEVRAQVFVFLATVTLLCISVVLSLVPLMTFITDAFGKYSASAMTATIVSRCLMGAFIPLVVPPLAEDMGYGWAFTVLAAVALVLAPIPCAAMRYGPVWRQKSEYTRDR